MMPGSLSSSHSRAIPMFFWAAVLFIACWQSPRSASADASPVPIRLVLIDGHTEKALGPLPWPRDYHARVISWLKQAGARAIVLRFYFRDEQDPKADAELVSSVLDCGSVFIETGRSESPQGWQPPPEWLDSVSLDTNGSPPADIVDLAYLQLPFAGLANAVRGIGSMDMLVDRDRKLRAMPLLVRHGRWLLPSLGLRTFLSTSGLESAPVTFLNKLERSFWLLPVMRTKGILIGNVRIALDDKACIQVDLSAPGSAYQAFSYADVLAGQAAVKPFSGAIVIVGSASPQTLIDTPIGAKNGPELVADQLSTLYEFAGGADR